MITHLNVNDENLIVEYDLDVQAIYFGDLESEYIDINISSVIMELPNEDGDMVNVNIHRVVKMLDQEESLKIILREQMEDYES